MDSTDGARHPLIVTGDDILLEDLMRLCAAASVTPDVVSHPAPPRRAWAGAPCGAAGAARADAVSALDLDRRAGVILVDRQPESSLLWRWGVAVRADHVVVVPDADPWLVERLADSVDGGAKTALTVGVVGARGGVGASVLATSLGMCAARRGRQALLVDVDPGAGGVELVAGCEDSPGLRWAEVAQTRGRVTARALRAALPSADGLAVLSWGRADDVSVDSPTLRAIMSSAQRGADLVLLDIGRHLDALTAEAFMAADVLVLVSTLDVRSAAGAARLLGTVRHLARDCRLVCRDRRGARLEPAELAETLQLPLAGVVATHRAAEHAVDDGLGPLVRGRMTREYERLLDSLAGAAVAPAG